MGTMTLRRCSSAAALLLAVTAVGPLGCSPEQLTSGADPIGLAAPAPLPSAPQHIERPAELTGPGCDAAASYPDNPMLEAVMLSAAKDAGLRAQPPGSTAPQRFTVFVPEESALDNLDEKTVHRMRNDASELLKIIAHHLVPVDLPPDRIGGRYLAADGGEVTVTRSADGIDVDDAKVICGGFRTATATVYLIDRVLTRTSL